MLSLKKTAVTLEMMAQVEVGALDAYEQSPRFSSYNTVD
jgi:hypothetical protein